MIIVGDVIGCILWGALIAVVVTVVVFLVCRTLVRDILPLAWLVLALLFFLSGAQGSMMVGAMYGKGYVAEVQDALSALLPSKNTPPNLESSVSDAEALRDQISDSLPPYLRPFFNDLSIDALASYAKDGGRAVANYVAADLNDALDYYILRRVLWLLGFVLVSIVAICLIPRKRMKTYDPDYGLDSDY